MRRREGYKPMWVEAPVELVERMAAVAQLNRRSLTGEALVAFERHVAAEEAARAEGADSKPKGKRGGK
jgi:hypothetical protein